MDLAPLDGFDLLNNRCLPQPFGNAPRAETEAACYAREEVHAELAAWPKPGSLRRVQGGSRSYRSCHSTEIWGTKMIVADQFSPLARGIIVAAALAIVTLFLQAAAPIVGPLLLAVFITVIAHPPLRWMQRMGVPKYLALSLMAFILLDAGSLLALAITGAMEGLRDSLPSYQQRLVILSQQIGNWLESIGLENSSEAVPELLNPAAATRLVQSTLANLSSSAATGLMVLLAVVFMLIEAPGVPAKLRAAFKLSEASEERFLRILDAVNYYMHVKFLTSLATGLLIGLWLWYLRIDFAILWAIIAVFLNFVPYVGAILMTIPAVLVALVQTDLPTALLVALGYLVVNAIIGNIVEPRIMGRGLGVSEVALFIFMVFWGWVLGTIGVFLSVPLTMAVITALDASPQTRPLAIMLRSSANQPGAIAAKAPEAPP